MADDKTQAGFSHIVVGGDFDDDDVVIVAGAPKEAEPIAPDATVGQPSFEEDAPSEVVQPIEGSIEASRSFSQEDELDSDLTPDEVSKDAPDEKGSARPKPKSKDGYHETTLEDLESSKMSPTQKIVIVVAVVLIACAVAWCFLH